MAEQVQALQTGEVERQVADALEDPSDLWRDGLTLAEVTGDDGRVDVDKLDAAVLQVATDHPGWRKRPTMPPDTDQGRRSDFRAEPTWTGLLRDGAQRQA